MRNKMFLVTFIIIIVVGMSTLIRNQKDFSYAENRKLAQFPHFTVNTFLNSEYQNVFNSALSDQFAFAQTVKTKMNDVMTFADYTNINKLICKNRYVQVTTDISIFDCSDRFVLTYYKYEEKNAQKIAKRMKKLKEVIDNQAELYFYVVNDAKTFDFSKNELTYNIPKIINSDNVDAFTYKNFDEYSNLFYKTDHHWNHKGSYKGYTEVIKLLKGKDEPVLKPIEEIDFKTNSVGSLAKLTGLNIFEESFKAYKFDIPKHDEYINGKKGKYGKYEEYLKGKVPQGYEIMHYLNYYGGDAGELIYDFYNNKNKENLLIMGNSYQQAISLLVASHFHKTYVVDHRYYEQEMNKKFNYQDYIKKNKIDKVIVIGNYSEFANIDLNFH